MSPTRTMASGEQLTLLCNSAGVITRRQADTWLRQRQAAQANPTTTDYATERKAS